jgi:hypothetical protein
MVVGRPTENRKSGHGNEDNYQTPVVGRSGNWVPTMAFRGEHRHDTGDGADQPRKHMHRHDAEEYWRG